MIRFIDGPADGAELALRRAPLFLRLVVDRDGELRALDGIDQAPAIGDVIYVYERIEPAANVKRGAIPVTDIPDRCRVEYRWFTAEPVIDRFVRGTEEWRSWCLAQQQRIAHGIPPVGSGTERMRSAECGMRSEEQGGEGLFGGQGGQRVV